MKLKALFLSMAATLAFVGCSSEDDPINKGNENTDDGYGYVAVNIVEPKSVGSRANASDQFEDGTTDENKAESALFFIYNGDGTARICDPQMVSLTDGATPGTNPPYVEKIYKAVLVIDGIKNKPTSDYQVVCVLNAPDALKGTDDATKQKSATLETLRKQIADYGASTAGAFIMTNSVYKDGTTEVCGTIVPPDKLKNSASAALASPVDIYVERVVARIQAEAGSSFTNSGADPAVDGKTKPLTIKVTGIEVANIAQNSYLFKDIESISYDIWTWNDPTNKRSYWETVPALTFANKSYADIATDASFDITKVKDFKEYVQPNTSTQKTAILVTAQLMDGANAADLAYIRGGYTTKAGAKDLVATFIKNSGYCKASGTGYTSILPEDLEWVNNKDLTDEGKAEIGWLESYEVVARVKSTVTGLYKKNADGTSTALADATDINDLLKGTDTSHPYVARIYTDGKCYYFVNIDQTPVATDNGYTGTDKFEGVIRNHIYKLTLNSIKGVGTPVFDPTDVIVPEIPEDETLWFLGAQINVLKWRLVSQTVDFTGK